MFKTDSKTLEELSFSLDGRDIANFKSVLENLQNKKVLTISNKEVQKAIKGLETIGQLKLDNKIYAFHLYDSYAEMNGNPEGVELFLRQGNSLNLYFQKNDRDSVYRVRDAINFLKKKEKNIIYTGRIPFNSDFLGLADEIDPEDPLSYKILDEEDIIEFESAGIEVIKLDSLI